MEAPSTRKWSQSATFPEQQPPPQCCRRLRHPPRSRSRCLDPEPPTNTEIQALEMKIRKHVEWQVMRI